MWCTPFSSCKPKCIFFPYFFHFSLQEHWLTMKKVNHIKIGKKSPLRNTMMKILKCCMKSGRSKFELSVSILAPHHIYWIILTLFSSLKYWSKRNDEEKIPEDELPYGHPDRPNMKSFKLEDIDVKNPESIKRASKMNKNVILLATISGNPTR